MGFHRLLSCQHRLGTFRKTILRIQTAYSQSRGTTVFVLHILVNHIHADEWMLHEKVVNDLTSNDKTTHTFFAG
jgi:hypothetical protein